MYNNNKYLNIYYYYNIKKKLMNENMIIKYIIKKLYRLMVPQMTMTVIIT